MTSQSPRIYLYKITFEEVFYYYYGVHKEKKYDEYYMGSPVANKWCWEFYTPKKQILELFDYTDDGYKEAQKVEGRLIKPVFNTDKWCLNANCMGVYSLEQKSKAGKKAKELGVGIFELKPEQKRENSRKRGKIALELKIGIHNRTLEQRIEDGRKGGTISGKRNKELGVGVCGRSKEKMIEDGRKGGIIGGNRTKELGVGVCGRSKEQIIEDGRKGGKIASKIINAQRWECCETGYVSTSAGVVHYQKARGIDTSKSNRRRIA